VDDPVAALTQKLQRASNWSFKASVASGPSMTLQQQLAQTSRRSINASAFDGGRTIPFIRCAC
jgi:hypothetical protein